MSRYAVIDKITGEVVQNDILFIGKNPKYVDKGFVKVFVAFLSDVVENTKIAGKAIRLLFYMLEQMDYNTYTIKIIPKYAQETLGVSRETFYNWLDALIEEEIITKIDTYTYRLNPYVAVKGSSYKATINDIKEEKKSQKKPKKIQK